MNTPEKNQLLKGNEEETELTETSLTNDAVEDDGTPVLDEEDLEENGLTVEDAENIVWEEPKEGDEGQ